jgi:hypothetical protein
MRINASVPILSNINTCCVENIFISRKAMLFLIVLILILPSASKAADNIQKGM